MGCLGKLVFLSVLAFGIGIGYFMHLLNTPPEIPTIVDRYWGPGSAKPDDTTIKPFTINISNSDLDDFKMRLKSWREGPEPLEGIGFQYGFNKKYLKDLLAYWKNTYDWRKREKVLNSLPQYKTQLSGLDIHFLHAKPNPKTLSKGVEVVPLLLLHGWPGSVKEFYKMIPLLITPRPGENFVFEIVAPSLPGYGWSQGSSKPGMGPPQIAHIFNKLMKRLGFNKYYVQGGDWGSVIGSNLAILFPESVIGYHTNMCSHGSTLTQVKQVLCYLFPWIFATEEPVDKMSSQLSFMMEETGYMHLQSTKPDTVGTALSDSPVGLAAYIIEKFSTWTNPAWKSKQDGGLSNYKEEDLLDNIMIYWFSNSITTSMRLYSETFTKDRPAMIMGQIPITTPTGCARFPSELLFIPKKIIEQGYHNLVRFSDMPKGGHFAAFEVPELLAEDIWQFTQTVRDYYKNLNKKTQK